MLVFTPCLTRSFQDRGEAIVFPLLKKTFQRPSTLSFAWYASRRSLSNAIPRHHPGSYPPLASRSTNASISSRTFNRCLVGPCRSIQQSPVARRAIQGLRQFHHSRKTQQRPYFPGSQYNSYRTDTFTLYYRAAQLTFLGTFLVVYLALHIIPQPVRQRLPAPTSTLNFVKQHFTSVRKSIQNHLTRQNLSYRPRDWPPGNLRQCTPYVGYMFAHESATHLAVNSLSLYFLTSYLFPAMGILASATTFLAGGIMASQIDCATANAYANSWNPWHKVVASLHVTPRDPNPSGTLGSSRLGASAGLCSMFAVAAISNPSSRWRFMLVPVGIPLWVLWSGELAWEGYSFYNNVDDGIGHGGHLAGHLAGVVLWFVALRWTGYGRMCRELGLLRRPGRYDGMR